ncbi:GNAT family N-acetyltransferase [Paenibacillus sp.]|uniref:GNAT family N-acetyltransferase n=1 Tax=Paenibacillus sp. TaxID=58172 RepID=UPI002D4E873A|nr:GNAT family N-acetyltransferase [Paenibacillus sp.]HZG86734.1 GNAT family N-acetyltransferase [Paenibacillus sp.]
MSDAAVVLVKPSMEYREEYLSFYTEWKASGEEMVPWVIEREPTDFESMLAFLSNHERGVELPDGWVPDSTLWLVDERGRVIGAVNIRHRLTEWLLRAGGHIGMGIRPSERRRGYGKAMLELALAEAKRLGIERALLVCDADNAASERTIVGCGGVRDEDFVEADGRVFKRYWIRT